MVTLRQSPEAVVSIRRREALRVGGGDQLPEGIVGHDGYAAHGVGDLHRPPVVVAVPHGGVPVGVGDGGAETAATRQVVFQPLLIANPEQLNIKHDGQLLRNIQHYKTNGLLIILMLKTPKTHSTFQPFPPVQRILPCLEIVDPPQ